MLHSSHSPLCYVHQIKPGNTWEWSGFIHGMHELSIKIQSVISEQWKEHHRKHITLMTSRSTWLELPVFCVYFCFDCCLIIFAGTFVHKECERDQDQGICASCEHGQTYTEHSNGMNRCLPCTHCRLGKKTHNIIFSCVSGKNLKFDYSPSHQVCFFFSAWVF